MIDDRNKQCAASECTRESPCSASDASREEVMTELCNIADELITHLASVRFAFDPKDWRAVVLAALCKAYQSRLCAAVCGLPDPDCTDEAKDMLRGKMPNGKDHA